ncbi:acyl CoA:acetate/3-ketoacid CoA transferase [Ruegeria sp. EL01]|uniref:acyl CoA:acetate/3-ketoacid CoA transferase n=1 Tax=Ruegeria sp. EL01 TaxID=2107578 RepID=UPI000EA81363|nr:CoA-transferase [Ruegeria sp. EL01]
MTNSLSDISLTPDQIGRRIPDGAVLAVSGSGGGLMEPDELLEAIERRFLETGHPRDLTLVHSFGLGDGDRRGTNRLAHAGLVKRVIGGHWSWSPRMQSLAESGQIEAYTLPTGVLGLLLRECGAGRPGLITKTGLGTFVDPETGNGGALNDVTHEPLVERCVIDGETYLRYKPIRVDVALVRGSAVDESGNLSTRHEPADLDVFAMALAARNSGGRVYAQVQKSVTALPAREVALPNVLVNGIAICPGQTQTYRGGYRPDFSGDAAGRPSEEVAPTGIKRVIAKRAALEMPDAGVVNLGFGVSASVVHFARIDPRRIALCAEQGIYNGVMETGPLFGIASGPSAIIPATSQFDFYSGGGLDVTFLGMAELDGQGNVNVSHLGKRPVGPGGFIDISQNTPKIVFCGTFNAKGVQIDVAGNGLSIRSEGSVRKLVDHVRAITFSGAQAQTRKAEVIYVTERAVFGLTPEGVVLREIAPGIDLERDVLAHMGFTPIIGDVSQMPAEVFS